MASNFAEFRFGWPVIVASAIGIGLGMSPLPFYTIGIFAVSFNQEFGWTQDQTMFALLIFTFAALVTSPTVGLLSDRFGVRRVTLTSVLLFSLTMMSFSLLSGSLLQYYVLWGVLAAFGTGTLPITWTRGVNSWFFKKRGLALGLALMGTGIAGFTIPPLTRVLIDEIGWRDTYVVLGALPLLIALPVAYFLFREASDPKVAHRAAKMIRHTQTLKVRYGGLSLAEAAKDWRFWLLAYSFVPISFAVGGPIPNMYVLLQSKGFSAVDAAWLLSIIGISVIFGRLVGGFLLDHFWAPAVAAVILSVPAVACFLLSQSDVTLTMAIAGIAILGFAAGVEYDLMAYLVSRYFGMLHYAAIYGALYGFFAFGAGVGPVVFGWSFRVHGSFDLMLTVGIFLFLAGALPLLLLGKYRDFETPLEPEQSSN